MKLRAAMILLAGAGAFNGAYQTGRALGKQDDNEFIRLHVPDLMKAK